MDAVAIIELVAKGITVVEALIEAGKDAMPAVAALKAVIVDKQAPTQDDLDRTESVLDALMDEFNSPLPPADEA